jgi:2-dehydropantoate 2-reductase
MIGLFKRSQGKMNILVYGAGVIGSVYAARLQRAGYNVTLLARGQRAASLRTQGILLENASTGQRTTTHISVIDHLAPKDTYDVVLVTVRMDQLASILPMLAINHQIPTVLFMLNNPLGIQQYEILGLQRVVLGFPSVGGTRQDEVIRYILIRQQQTTLGEVDGRVTPRLQQLATTFKKAGFSVALSPDMQAWLKTHAIFVSCISAALTTTEGDSVRLGRTRESVVMMVQAIREGFMALKAQGTPISPFNLKVLFLWMPRWFAVLLRFS